MRFRDGDELLSMAVLGGDADLGGRYVFTVTDGGFAKRTAVAEYRQQGRGGLGIKATAPVRSVAGPWSAG